MTATAADFPAPLTAPRIFGLSLLVVTVVPFLAAGLKYAFPESISFSVQQAVFILAGIHVPLTAYLLLDPKIRSMMRERPLALIGVPVLIFAVCIAVFFLSWESRQAGHAWPMVYFWLAVLAWNNWHFGKQNIGVYSFFRLSQSTPGVLPIERSLILAGTVLGSLLVLSSGNYIAAYTEIYAKQETLEPLKALATIIGPVAKFLQYGLLAAVIGYLAFNWRRYTVGTATALILSANFFFPQYLHLDLPAWTAVFACSSLAHGTQYCVFLGSHAAQYKPSEGERGPSRYGPAFMAVALVLIGIFFADAFLYNKLIPKDFFTGLIVKGLGRVDLVTPAADAAGMGILLSHFWLDSFFWRFKNPTSRTWMLNRYAFLFRH
jgi:hypothetical protein